MMLFKKLGTKKLKQWRTARFIDTKLEVRLNLGAGVVDEFWMCRTCLEKNHECHFTSRYCPVLRMYRNVNSWDVLVAYSPKPGLCPVCWSLQQVKEMYDSKV